MPTRTRIKVNTEAPPQWRGREGWIVEKKSGDYYLVDMKGGGQAVLHESEFTRQDETPPEPQTTTVMVGHCPVTVPASTVQAWGPIVPYRHGFGSYSLEQSSLSERAQTGQAWEGTEPTIPASAWPAYSADYEAGYRAGYEAGKKEAFTLKPCAIWHATLPETTGDVHAQQASDFERIVSMERKTDRD